MDAATASSALAAASTQQLLEVLEWVDHAKECVPDGPAGRGRAYRRRVEDLMIEDDLSASARVQGSRRRPYEVWVDVLGDRIDAVCECPYSSFERACKHTWATLDRLGARIEAELQERGALPAPVSPLA